MLRGRVVRGDTTGVGGIPVVFHRVTPDSAGELDTLSAGPDGSFTFPLPTVPDPGGRDEVYFGSVSHDGVLYFGPAVTRAVQLDSAYTIVVHDTAAAAPGGAELPVAVRYLVMEEAEDGWQVTDLFALENRRGRTLVAREGDVVWAYPLPEGIRDLRVGGGDLDPAAVSHEDGVLTLSSPLPPGERRLVVRYRLDEPRLTVPLPGNTEEVELLIREPAPALAARGLQLMEPVEMEPGSTYRRFAARDVTDGEIEIRPGEGSDLLPDLGWVMVGVALLLGAAGVWAVGRGSRPPPAHAHARAGAASAAGTLRDARDRLLLEIARVDQALEGEDDEAARAELRGRRQELTRRLKELAEP